MAKQKESENALSAESQHNEISVKFEKDEVFIENKEGVKKDVSQHFKKEQKASVSYALKAVTKHMETLRDAGLMHQAIYEQVMLELEASKREFVRREFGI